MLTIEEAGEIILRGKPWVMCYDCRGLGTTHKPAPEVGDPMYLNDAGSTFAIKACKECMGAGWFLCEDYKEAAELLKLEVPQNPKAKDDNVWKTTVQDMQVEAHETLSELYGLVIGYCEGLGAPIEGIPTVIVGRGSDYSSPGIAINMTTHRYKVE